MACPSPPNMISTCLARPHAINWIRLPKTRTSGRVRLSMTCRRTCRQRLYPSEHIRFVEGKVETTIPLIAPERIAILRLDTDWYESTAHELHHLYPRLVPGGVLIIDDYGHWEGARRAVDEYFAANGGAPLLQRIDYTGRMAVKP